MQLRTRLTFAVAGAAGAALWAALQPLDKRVLRSGYDDVELLGRAVRPDSDGWRPIGWAMHVGNGAVFGLAYAEVWRRTPSVSPWVSAQAMALGEHVSLFPLGALVDRVHPARGDLAPIFGRRQFLQATWRHAVLGAVLGVVGERLARD